MAQGINAEILEAMNLLAKAATEQLKYDTTIEVEIYNVDNSSLGQYKAKYLNTILDVYTDNPTVKYKVGEMVNVLVPLGDMNKKKMIISAKSGTSSGPIIEVTDPIQKVDLIGVPLDKLYPYNSNVQMPGYFSQEYEKNFKPIFEHSSTANDSTFQSYCKGQNKLVIQAKFKTRFDPTQRIDLGNYGLLVVFAAVENGIETLKSFKLDCDLMKGNPYTNREFVTQSIVLDTDANNFKYLKSIALFSHDFKHYDTDLNQIADSALIIDEIFVSDIKLQFARPIESLNGYSAHILTPVGIYLNYAPIVNGKNTLSLNAQFKFNGQDIIRDAVDFKINWYQRDLTIGYGNPNYSHEAGAGWKKIENTGTVLYVNDAFFVKSGIFKVIITYQDTYVQTASVTVFLSPAAMNDYYLNYTRDASGMIKLKVVGDLTQVNKYLWSYTDVNGVSREIINNKEVLEINSLDIYLHNTYTCCLVSGGTTPKIITVLEYTVYSIEDKPEEEEDDRSVAVEFSTDRQGYFSYNEKGYIKAEEFLSPKTLSFEVITRIPDVSYSYEWIIPGFINTTQAELLPIDVADRSSMLSFAKNIRIRGTNTTPVDQQVLQYKINSYFDRDRNNNVIQLNVTIDEVIYVFYFNFVFSKVGDLGTNGTEYELYYEPFDDIQAIQHNGTAWQTNSIRYRLSLYKNGLRENLDNYKIELSIPDVYLKNTYLCKGDTLVPLRTKLREDLAVQYLIIDDPNSSSTQVSTAKGKVTQLENAYSLAVAGMVFKYDPPSITNVPDVFRFYIKNDMPWNESKCANLIQVKIKHTTLSTEMPYDLITLIPITVAQRTSYSLKNQYLVVYNAEGREPSFVRKPSEVRKTNVANDSAANITSWTYSKVMTGQTLLTSVDSVTGIIKPKEMYYAPTSFDAVKASSGNVSIITPIAFQANAYELASINGWDGISVVVDTKGGYILAPQIGAGYKDDLNRFNGVIMGEYFIGGNTSSTTGLWGFQDGAQSFGFKTTGEAFLGRSDFGGQIVFDGNGGIIRSANFKKTNGDNKGTGMEINLNKGHIEAADFSLNSNHMKINSNEEGGTFEILEKNGLAKIEFTGGTFAMYANQSGSSGLAKAIYFDAIKRKYVIEGQVEIDGTLISQNVIVNNLYAGFGNVADLRVSSVKTDHERPFKFLHGETDTLYYTQIETDTSGGDTRLLWMVEAKCEDVKTSPPIQFRSKDGKLLYWNADPYSGETPEDELLMQNKQNDWPVMVYQYTDKNIKYSQSFVKVKDTVYPMQVWGAGDEGAGTKEKGIGYIYKDLNSFRIEYESSVDEELTATLVANSQGHWFANGIRIDYELLTRTPTPEDLADHPEGTLFIVPASVPLF